MAELPTVRVMSDNPEHGGFVVINEADFDPKVHKRWVKTTNRVTLRLPKMMEAEDGSD